jgi:hypothetical protein
MPAVPHGRFDRVDGMAPGGWPERARNCKPQVLTVKNIFRVWFPQYHPRNIFIAGWPASGSTFLYQVAVELGLNVHRKKHGLRRPDSVDFTLFAFRDPRDVLCSHARRMHRDVWDSEGPEAAILKSLQRFLRKRYREAIYESAAMKNVFLIRYELFFNGNEELLVDLIADNFLIPVTPERRAEILANTSLDTNLQRSRNFESFREHDEQTQIHGHHISNRGRSGAWREHFTPAVEASVKEHLGQLLIDLAYEKDLGWSA